LSKYLLGQDAIRELLPHRYPFLMVDRVLHIEGNAESVVAEKLVSGNEPFFQGHFPGRPVMPGVLIVEALAQAAGLAIVYARPELRNRGVAMVGLDKFRFRKPVLPGDVLTLSARLLRHRGNIYVFEGTAQVLGEVVASGEMMAAFVDWEDKR
jgi:beta-hydroxyacyl-ACP dehydratase FabZ